MDVAAAIRDFLMTRRANVTPEQVGLPSAGRRRVAGLRREEVAMLAGVSVEYYVQIERGRLAGVSDDVLGAIARALLLDDVETSHLFDLAHAARDRASQRPRARAAQLPQGVRLLIDAMTGVPAMVQNSRLDILATNALGAAVFAPVLEAEAPNMARFVFFDARAPEFFTAWESIADDAAAMLRVHAGKNPYDRSLSDLVGELSTRSEHFAQRWAKHNVRAHHRGVKAIAHPTAGELTLGYESMQIPGRDELTLLSYLPEPGSPSAERLALLASWVTAEQRETQAQGEYRQSPR
ncbi:helix-turn-helix domain-containing protein [Leucobacter tenebrionis]|uniref:helix-turn-helix domain-containing protein n=1 Tax=Leucobacter tenebrionis TaxID=2873270 RepID=UPI001CA72EE2|nr:helix-turn-helix transcriptional regulator [Leucobacter tenebrionis]QZY51772.1 helix-turn-helix transcriptional regulator [Leucobacter tenebrionis]